MEEVMASPKVGQLVTKDPYSLKEFAGNPKKHDLPGIRASIRMHGQYRPIVISADDVVLAGHGTLQGLKDEGLLAVDCFQLNITSQDPRALKIMLGDNRLAEVGGMDTDALVNALAAALTAPDLLAGTGYSIDDYEDLLAQLEEVAVLEPEFKGGYAKTESLPEPEGSEAPVEPTDVRQIVVTVTAEQHREFALNVRSLRQAWHEESSSAAIMRAVAMAAKAVEDEAGN